MAKVPCNVPCAACNGTGVVENGGELDTVTGHVTPRTKVDAKGDVVKADPAKSPTK